VTYDAKEKSRFGGKPVELYRVVMGLNVWTYTSGDKTVVYADETYAKETITRSQLDQSQENERGSLEITVPRTNPIAQQFVAYIPALLMHLTIYRYHRGDPEYVVIFVGQVVSAKFEGPQAELVALPLSECYRKSVPVNLFQGQCNWPLFGSACGKVKTSYEVVGTLSYVTGLTIQSSAFGDFADGYFTNGWVETYDGDKRWVTRHVGATITLLSQFTSIAAGDVVRAYPGCDRTIAACKDKYANLNSFCGFPFTPTRNPFVSGV
jgi:uncharacterized phage protein (TIGR02218 family)